MTEKEIAPGRGRRGGRGRGLRGGGGGRGGGKSSSARGIAHSGAGAGGRGSGNHFGSSSQQPQAKQDRGGKGTGRPRSSSLNESSDCPPKKSGPYTHLFCSERHAFALSRVLYPRNSDQFLLPSHHLEESRNRQRAASDDQLERWWESVKIVKCHVPFNESLNASSKESNRLSFLDRCPICLDEDMVSPFIAPCGHIFCLPCSLGYLNSVAKDLNTQSESIHKNKHYFKGCAGVVGSSSAITNSASVTTIRARCPMCSSGSSLELNAGEAMITYKDLRPVVFVPVLDITVGTRMRFVKLHRVKTCPAPYLPLEGRHVRGASASATLPRILDQHFADLPDEDSETDECIYSRQHFVGLQEYESVLQRDLDDLNRYRDNSVYSQMDPREAWNVAMAIEAIKAAQRRWLGDGGFRGMELDAKSAAIIRKQLEPRLVAKTTDVRDDATIDAGAAISGAKSRKNSPLLQPGSFLQEEPDEYLYYQSSDGQPYYLSGFDLACLVNEFSIHRDPRMPADNANQDEESSQTQVQLESPSKPRRLLPLPDELDATVVEIEQLSVTPSLIKRKPFLSHLPLHSNVSFVEIDWCSGGDRGNQPLLSHRTLTKFRGEFHRRRSERLRAAKREQTADKVAREKAEKEEQRQRRELLCSTYSGGGSCRQTIDPDDEFFRPQATSFDENDEGARWNRFNEVCATGGVWPELAVAVSPCPTASVSHVQSSPVTVSSSSPPRMTNSTWGSRSHSSHHVSCKSKNAKVLDG
ncbi:hypothetical protein ACHAW5_003605 [Stephanodiscus triporus]|uniref:RING-type domain-containing protein n=1 Tax=Stephanodiscus triporus TaxID=2934178 RepID=A0ABD3PDF9_9STRA